MILGGKKRNLSGNLPLPLYVSTSCLVGTMALPLRPYVTIRRWICALHGMEGERFTG